MNIVSTIVESLKEMVVGSASAIGDGVQGLLFDTTTEGATTLSTAGVVIFTLLGIAMAFGLMYVIINLFTRP